MLFELRNSLEPVSEPWTEVRDHFHAGRARTALQTAESFRGKIPLQTANDFVLNIEIARANGILKPYLALVRMAQKAFPADPIVQLYYSRMLQTRGRFMVGIEYLLDLESTLGKTHTALWGSQLANLYGDAGFGPSSRSWLEKIKQTDGYDSPLALYNRACAMDGLREWDQAIKLSKRCVESAPNWSRARVHLVHCLLARGRIEEAIEQFQETNQLGHEEAYIDFSAAMTHCAQGDFESSAAKLSDCVEHWPHANFNAWAKRMLYVLHVENGRFDEASAVAEKLVERGKDPVSKLGLPKVEEIAKNQAHKFIPIPLVVQNTSQCVPTTVAMASYPQGRRYDPDVLYKEMMGRNGTPLWRMREWVAEHEMVLIPIQLNSEAIIGLLEQGIPLIGTLHGSFSSHVDVICGYHAGLKVFYVRDPAHWGPMVLPYEFCMDRYALDDGVIAIIDRSNDAAVKFAERWKSEGLESLLDLQQAVSTGDLPTAEAAAGRIPDDSILAYQRDSWGCNVTLPQSVMAERMQKLAQDPQANSVARFRCIMGLDPDESKTIFEQLLETESDTIGFRGRLYVSMFYNYRKKNWRTALSQLERVMLRGSSVADLWSIRSDLLNELGREKESDQAMEMALELAPENLNLLEKAIGARLNQLTHAEHESQIEELIKAYPHEHSLIYGRVHVRQNGPDGKAYESALRDHLHWYPRDMRGYSSLAHWYSSQGRSDLVDKALDEAKAIMPELFQEQDKQENDDPSATTPSNNGKDSEKSEPTDSQTKADELTKDSPLPEENLELLDIVWNSEDPRSARAVAELKEREASDELKWAEHAQWVAAQLVMGNGIKQPLVETVKEILPATPKGPIYWYVHLVLDYMSHYSITTDNAQAVLDWQQAVAPEHERYANLWFNRILMIEHTKDKERALVELDGLLEANTGFSSGLYRKGVLKQQQGDLTSAAEYFERALEVNPGLYGAMDQLCNVYYQTGNTAGYLDNLIRLRDKLPYNYVAIRDEMLGVFEVNGSEAAWKTHGQLAPRVTPLYRDILSARLLANERNVPKAQKLFTKIQNDEQLQTELEKDETAFEELLQARLSVAIFEEDSAKVDACCAEGIARWPNSTRLKLIRVQHGLADPQETYRDVLVAGKGDSEMAFRFLLASSGRYVDIVSQLVQQIDNDDPLATQKRQELAELFSEVMNTPELIHQSKEYLNWAYSEFPESVVIKYRLADHLNLSGKSKKAAELAREMHESDPDNLELLRFYGRTLTDTRPKKALELLKQACEKNRSVSYLFDLARCYQLAGDKDQSKVTHREILRQNPFVGASVTNLYLMDEPAQKLWPLAKEIVAQKGGLDDEYFLVAAVKMAISQKDQMPVEWEGLAQERLQILGTHPGYLDETQTLKKAWRAWTAVRGSAEKKKSWTKRILSNLSWPGTKWIPPISTG